MSRPQPATSATSTRSGSAPERQDPAAAPVLHAREVELVGLPDSRIDLELATGERWLIAGAAGSGKTTLARTLLGLISPAAGSIELFGSDLDELAPETLLALRRATVLVSPSDGLFPAWSGFDNLALPLRYHGMPGGKARQTGATIDAQIAARARACGMPDSWLEQPVTERSREQRLALALMRATFTAPRLLIIDGIALEHTLASAGIDGAALLADALADNPAIIALQPLETGGGPAGPGMLPIAFDPPRFRRARLAGGRLQWLPAPD